jgi:hypothetical protein
LVSRYLAGNIKILDIIFHVRLVYEFCLSGFWFVASKHYLTNLKFDALSCFAS